MASAPDISVVIPSHGRRASLLRVLHALARQTMPGASVEVVVVCDGDVDGSIAACRVLTANVPYTLRVIEQENQGPAAARNRGVDEARAPLIVFLDDDVVPEERLLIAHREAHSNQGSRITIGTLLPPRDARLTIWALWEEEKLCRQYADMAAGRWQATPRQFYTGNAGVLRRHLIEAGGFNAAFQRAEDVELAWRLHDRGLHFEFLPEAQGRHYIQRSLAAWLRIPAAYGAADVAMARAGREGIARIVAEDYRTRSRPVRIASRLCAGRSGLVWTITGLCSAALQVAEFFHLQRAGSVVCSIVFSVQYYDGLATALGSRHALQRLLGGRGIGTSMVRSDETSRK